MHSVTTASTNVHDDADERLKRYAITMGIRTLCFILAVVTIAGLHWTWGWVFVPGAIFLPYVAVIGANAHEPRQAGTITQVTDRGPRELGHHHR